MMKRRRRRRRSINERYVSQSSRKRKMDRAD